MEDKQTETTEAVAAEPAPNHEATPVQAAPLLPAEPLSRAQRRLLRRVYNARSTPVMVDGLAFMTYRQASAYLLKLAGAEREAAYGTMKLAGAR